MENSDDNDKEIDKHAIAETSDKSGTETPKPIKKTSRRVKSHVCKTCDKSFFTKCNLKNHIRNSHDKPEQCQICGKGFGKENALKIHVKVVHEKRKDYQCEFCQRSFGQKSQVNKHVKNRSCKKSKYVNF